MKPRATLWTIATTLIGIGALPFVAATCSLGEGATPTCDPNLPPTDQNACHQVAWCDDGMGGVKQDSGCCTDYATREYERCSANFSDNFTSNCPAGSSDPCCTQAVSTFDLCMAGGLLGGGGNSGTGGTGAAATTGGAGGT